MRARSTVITLAAAAGMACVLVPTGIGSGDRTAVRPTGFPLVWRETDDTLVGLETTPTVRRIHGVWELQSSQGQYKAFLYASWREPLGRKSRPAMCGGLRYFGRYVVETIGNAGEAWFGLAGDQDGTAHLTITHRIAIYKEVGPPVCVQATGTVDGMTGLLIGFEGTFTLRNDSTLVFRPS